MFKDIYLLYFMNIKKLDLIESYGIKAPKGYIYR